MLRDWLVIINVCLDDLIRCLEFNGEYNFCFLRFYFFEGCLFWGWLSFEFIYECYVWLDKDVKWIYGYFEDNVFIIDKLGLYL